MTITTHLRINKIRTELAMFARKRDEAKSNGEYSDACYYNRLWQERVNELNSLNNIK